MNFREYIKNNRVLYDGAFSTYYAEINGKCLVPEMANIKDRETVLKIHKEYVDAGAVLIRTNTFEANTGSLGCDKEELKSIIKAGWEIAKEACGDKAYVAADIGPIETGAVLKEYEFIIDCFIEQGAEIFNFESFADIDDVIRPLEYLKKQKLDAFAIVNFCLNQHGFTQRGAGAERLLEKCDGIDTIDAMGFNCGVGPIHLQNVLKKIKFNFGISSNYFLEIAKFRAARMLWAQIVKQYNPACDCACKMKAHAQTSEFNQTIFDAHVNLLRSQTETMSAALAGVDSITTTPFDKAYKEPDDFSERIARNQQLLLKEESHLNRITDPAAGSYYVETLTVSIAEQAWKLFLEVEEKGGFYKAVKEGFVQNQVNASAETRHMNVARRKEILLGTNQYPNFNEVASDKIVNGEACGCGCGKHEGGHHCEPEFPVLNTKRAASDFETLRLATERSGKRPTVFMLTIGNLAMRLARSQFSSNFFACAGYKIVDNLGFETVQAGIDAALDAKADIVVLCSSDDEYAQYAPEAFKILDGRALFVVAGAPACMDELKALGITEFIHVRSNVLDTLKSFNEKLSI